MKKADLITAQANGSPVETKYGYKGTIVELGAPRKVYSGSRDFRGHTAHDGVVVERTETRATFDEKTGERTGEETYTRRDVFAPAQIVGTVAEMAAARERVLQMRQTEQQRLATQKLRAEEAVANLGMGTVKANHAWGDHRITGYNVSLTPAEAEQLASAQLNKVA